jgi:KipI family sensor histidine kinase inhibitor
VTVLGVHDVGEWALRFDVPPGERHAVAARLRAAAIVGVEDVVPGERSVTVRFAPGSRVEADRLLESANAGVVSAPVGDETTVVVPVRYDGPDLDDVATLTGMTPARVVDAHLAGEYVVAFIGFAPGFPYLDGLSAELRVPRLSTPRVRVDAGSVAIAGARCCVYPGATPGGWRIIGHTDLTVFDVEAVPPTPFAPGRRVRFVEAGV